MSIISSLKRATLLAVAGLALLQSPVATAADKEYSFKLENKSKQVITKILVSEDKKKWGFFDVGKGIPAGATVKMVWDKSTNNGNCENWIKCVYADGSESEPEKFDFCEDDLEIEFED